MNAPVRSMVPEKPYRLEDIAPGVLLRRLYPGGKAGPDNVVANDISGGQTWSEAVILGGPGDDFMMCIPDIRMPPNQLWPMHWHDCWTLVIVTEGKCLIGDWNMAPGDVFVAAPSVEYGPLVIGSSGCRLFEVFGDLALSPGGYGPEYRDHPTLQGGTHVFKARKGINRKNEGHSSLSLEGAEGMWKTRLVPGQVWDLGDKADPNRPVVRYTELAAGGAIARAARGDDYAAQLISGSLDAGGKSLAADDVLIAQRGQAIPALVAGADGAGIIEYFRSARAL